MADRSGAAGVQPGPDLIPDLEGFPDDLARLLQGYSVEALKRPASDGGWGVIENLGHLRDWEEIYLSRVERLLFEDNPELPVYDDQLWEIEHDYRGQDPHRVLDQLRAQRQQLVGRLREAPPESWERSGSLGGEKDVTLAMVVQRIRQHDLEHWQAVADALA
jgi:hypothetical protein